MDFHLALIPPLGGKRPPRRDPGGPRRKRSFRCSFANDRRDNPPGAPLRIRRKKEDQTNALGKLASQAALIEEMALGIEVGEEMRGEYYIPNRHLLYAAQVQSQENPFFKRALGEGFVRYYAHIKNAEIDRFQAEVSEWEQREYFEMF